MEGRNYYSRFDWWDHILTIPAPRIVVIEDVDKPCGLGAFVGEVHANILMALGCVALATNGAVRDISHLEASGFQMFAGMFPFLTPTPTFSISEGPSRSAD